MRMFTPDGVEVLVDKDQIPHLTENGWTKTAPEKEEEPPTSEKEESSAPDEGKTTARKKVVIKKKN